MWNLCVELWSDVQLIMYHHFTFSLASFWAHHCKPCIIFFVLLSKCHPWCLIVWRAWSVHALCSACRFGDTSPQQRGGKKKKNDEWRDDCAPSCFRPFTVGCSKASIKENTRPLFRCPFHVVEEKKKRGTTHENCKCYAASSSARVELMLLSRGALPALRDVLMTAVSVFGFFV